MEVLCRHQCLDMNDLQILSLEVYQDDTWQGQSVGDEVCIAENNDSNCHQTTVMG